MAHFALIDSSTEITIEPIGIVFEVKEVLVVNNEDCMNDEGNEDENVGANYLKELLKTPYKVVRTSYRGLVRKNFAGIGYYYSESLDAFIEPKPATDCDFDFENCKWITSNNIN